MGRVTGYKLLGGVDDDADRHVVDLAAAAAAGVDAFGLRHGGRVVLPADVVQVPAVARDDAVVGRRGDVALAVGAGGVALQPVAQAGHGQRPAENLRAQRVDVGRAARRLAA